MAKWREDKIHTHIFATDENKKLLNHFNSLAQDEFELALASKSILFVHFYLISNFSLFLFFTSFHSDSSISTRVDMLTTPGSGQATPGMWQKDDTLENFGMKPSTSGLWREAKLIDLNDDDDAWMNSNSINRPYPAPIQRPNDSLQHHAPQLTLNYDWEMNLCGDTCVQAVVNKKEKN